MPDQIERFGLRPVTDRERSSHPQTQAFTDLSVLRF